MTFSPHHRYLIIPGLNNSGPDHWQTRWETELGCSRVIQDDWRVPRLDLWSERIVEALRPDPRPALAIAHSFGCLALLAALPRVRQHLSGILLVAPASPEKFDIPLQRLAVPQGLPTEIVLSRNDPWLTPAQGQTLAAHLNLQPIDAGAVGHINAASGHGSWPEGWRILQQLCDRLAPRPVVADWSPVDFRPRGWHPLAVGWLT